LLVQFAGYAAATIHAASSHFAVSPDSIFRNWQVWRLVTGPFLPTEFSWPLALFSTFVVFIFGWHLECTQGRRRLLFLYFGGSIFAAFLWSVAALVWNWHRPLFGPVGPTALAVGALLPGLRRPFPAFLPFRVPVWVAVVAYIATWPLIAYAGPIDLSAHFLAGLFAILIGQMSRSHHGERTRPRVAAVNRAFADSSNTAELKPIAASPQTDPEFDRRVDELLRKITEAGYDSLSEDEISLLLEASLRYRDRTSQKPPLGAS